MKVWDDHDYGVNDGGKRVQDKTTRKKMFIENVLYFNGTKDIEEDMDKNRDIDTEHDDSIQVIGDNTEKPDQIHEQLLHAHGESLYHYNDIDDVAALCAALDVVISTKMTVPIISGGVGTSTKIANYRQSSCNNFLLIGVNI